MINKALYKIGLVLLLTVTFFSCEDTNGDNFKPDLEAGWVQHESSSDFIVITGVNSKIEVPVFLNTNVNTSGLEVHYVLEDVVGSTSILSGNTGVITFEKGQTVSFIELEYPSNLPSGLAFDVKLVSTSRDNVDVGASATTPIVRRVCVSKIATQYTGIAYRMEDENSEPVLIPDYEFQTELIPTDDSDVYEITSAWGEQLVPILTGNPNNTGFDYPGVIRFTDNNSDNSGRLTVDGSDFYGESGNPGAMSCGGQIIYTLSQGLFTADFKIRVVLTPVN